MKIYEDVRLCDVEFYGGAADRAKYLNDADFEKLETVLSMEYEEGLSTVELNDLFWFEEDFIAEILGYPDFDTLIEEKEAEKND